MADEKAKQNSGFEEEMLLIETRKTKALEKIANSLDALTIWFEEIDKSDWGDRIQWYLSVFAEAVKKKEDNN